MQHINQAGLGLIKFFEGLRLTAYADPGGVMTIGYGHTKGVQAGQVITQAQADQFLLLDVASAEDDVNALVKVPLSADQFSALVVFTYNVGGDAMKTSTLLSKLNSGDYAAAASHFAEWNKGMVGVGGRLQVEPGLVTRRAAERDLFLKTPAPSHTPTWRLFAPPDRWQESILVSPDQRAALAWAATALGLLYREDSATHKAFLGTAVKVSTQEVKVTPQAQHTSVSCGQASVAMACNALMGTHLTDTDINAKYGFSLIDALKSECGSRYLWEDAGNFTPAMWPRIQGGLPALIGLNGEFSASGHGHIVLLTKIAGDQVTFADPASGTMRTVSMARIESCPPHPDGKFVFVCKKIK